MVSNSPPEINRHTDMLGRAINVGDYLVYPGTIGRSGNLKFCEVVELVPLKESPYRAVRDQDQGDIVVRAAAQWFGKVEARTKLSRILYPNRAFLIPRKALPKEILAKIKTVPDRKAKE